MPPTARMPDSSVAVVKRQPIGLKSKLNSIQDFEWWQCADASQPLRTGGKASKHYSGTACSATRRIAAGTRAICSCRSGGCNLHPNRRNCPKQAMLFWVNEGWGPFRLFKFMICGNEQPAPFWSVTTTVTPSESPSRRSARFSDTGLQPKV